MINKSQSVSPCGPQGMNWGCRLGDELLYTPNHIQTPCVCLWVLFFFFNHLFLRQDLTIQAGLQSVLCTVDDLEPHPSCGYPKCCYYKLVAILSQILLKKKLMKVNLEQKPMLSRKLTW